MIKLRFFPETKGNYVGEETRRDEERRWEKAVENQNVWKIRQV
jgi:hypothetical protein